MSSHAMYDAVVIGAGPAGATAAKVLADGGCSVLLVERKALPRYKSCSGVLIGRTLQLVEQHFGAQVPRGVQCTPTRSKGMVFVSDTGVEQRFEQEGLNVWRSGFDGWLTEQARAAGAEVRDETRAIAVNEGDGCAEAEVCLRAVRGGVETVRTRQVVVCEGAAGALRRAIVGTPRDTVLTHQVFCAGSIGVDPGYFYAYLQPEFSPYDAWLNVKDGLAVFGVAVFNPSEVAAYLARFRAFLEAEAGLRIEKALGADRWVMPRVRPGCPLTLGQGSVLFCGEAAGFLNPMGEGISSAMDSGARAARSVLAHRGDPAGALEEYRKQTRFMHAHMQRQWHGVAQMASTFTNMRVAW